MGWCHEFGSSVRDGCAHPMVAGSASCSCPACGVVCGGRFAGCGAVWERGPRAVALVRPVDQGAGRPAPAPVAVAPAVPVAGPGPDGGDGRAEVLDWLRSAVDGLRAELAALADAVARQQEALGRLEEVGADAARLVALAESLPERIGAAVAEARRGRDGDGPASRSAWREWEALRARLSAHGREATGGS